MPSSYRWFQPFLQPTPLQGKYGQAWGAAFGALKDELASRAKQAVKMRFPLLAPPDALQLTGSERGLVRGASETDAVYAARVAAAWDAWALAGTAQGILQQLSALGYPRVVLAQVRQRYFQLNAAGALVVTTLPSGSWQIDAPPQSFWSKFQVLFVDPLPTSWLGGGFVQFHGGTGPAALTLSGAPTVDQRTWLKISVGGLSSGVARFQVSTDYGATWSANTTLGTGYTSGGLTVAFPFNTYVLGDVYSIAPTFNVPADGSAEASRIKSVVNQWRPAHATNAGYVILTAGMLVGYPANSALAGGDDGFIGGGSTTTWTA